MENIRESRTHFLCLQYKRYNNKLYFPLIATVQLKNKLSKETQCKFNLMLEVAYVTKSDAGAFCKTGLNRISNHLESILMGYSYRKDDIELRKHFSHGKITSQNLPLMLSKISLVITCK